MKIFLCIAYFIIAYLCCVGFLQKDKPTENVEAQIGRLLFYDTRLSINNTKSCATCHDPQLAFTDGLKTPTGAFGDVVKRNTPTLINLADNETFNWAD